jgi:PAS domain S-box-containing protein
MDTQPIFNKTARNLTLVYLLSLSFLAVLAMGGQWFIRQSLQKQTNQSNIINQAGRQRMLSQRIAKLSLLIERQAGSTQRKDWAQQLANDTRIWKQVHQDLTQGILLSVEPSTAIQSQLHKLTPVLNEIATQANKLAALAKHSPNTQNQALIHTTVNTVLTNEPMFLQGMEAITLQYSQEARASVLALKKTELLLFTFTLLVLMGIGFFFFRPTVKRCLDLMNYQQLLTEKSQQAEAALLAEQKFTHAILEATPGILYLYDTQKDTNIYVNKHITNILGYTCQDIQAMENQFIHSLLHPDDQPKVLAHKEQLRQANNNEVQSVEYRMKHKNGHFIWLHSREMVFSRNAQGVPTQTLTIAQDINQDKQNLENLEKSEAQYRMIVENASDMIYELDGKGYFTYANPILKKALGYSEEELSLLRYDQLVLGSHRHLAIGFYKQQLLVEESESYLELPVVHKNGHTLWFGINTRLDIEDQQVIHIRSIARDITARKLAEETALRAREVFEATSDLVSMSDQTGITYFNQPGKYLLGYADEDNLTGSTIHQFHTQASAENIQKVAHAVALKEGVWLGESTLRTKHGKEIPVSQMIIAHKNPDGSLKYLSTIARDISETKRAAQEMNNLQNLLSSVLDSSPSGIMAFKAVRNASGQIEDLEWILINKTAGQLMDESFTQLVGKRFLQEQPCESSAMGGLFDSYTQVIETGIPLQFTHQYEKEQSLCWLQVIAVKMEDGLVVTFQDVTEQQTSDLQLARQRAFYETILNQLPADVVVLDPNHRYLFLNPAAVRDSLLREWMIGKNVYEYCAHCNQPMEIAENRQELLNRVITQKTEVQWDECLTSAQGETSYHLRRYSPALDEAGNIKFIIGYGFDITERKIMENELKSQKEFIKQVLDTSPNMVFVKDWEGRFVFANQAASNLFKTPIQKMIGKTNAELVSDESLNHELLLEQDREIMRRGMINPNEPPIKYEQNYNLSSTGPLWYQIIKTPIIHANGTVQMLGIATDITEQKEAEEKLISSRRMLAESQRLARLGSWELDLEMTGEVTWSEETFRLLELEPTGITPSFENYIQMIHPEDAPLLINKIHKIIDDGQPYEVELRLLLPNHGGIRHTLSRGKMEYENGKQVKLVGIIQDVTERKLAEMELLKAKEEAEHSMKAKEMFLSTMSHEIRTPMNAVIGMTYLLLQENPKPDQVQNLQTLQFAAQNLLVLINDILDFSKIESGKIIFEEIDFSLVNLINGVKNSLKFQIEEKRIQLITRIDSQIPPTLMGDQVRLSQVLTNLISNAIKFTEKGSVTVEVGINRIEKANTYIDFSVTDTGIGISADKLTYIFESFAQASTDTTRKFGGTGLGLTITKRLLELQKSQIQVESIPGQGSRFFFTLAMKQSIKQEVHPAKSQAESLFEPLPHVKLLLVEDNATNQLIARKFLNKWGISPDYALNGRIAVDKVLETDYDIILMDLQMPEMDGYEATRIIRSLSDQKYKNLPIVALTASAMLDVINKVTAIGMTDYVTKPFNPSELYSKIVKYTSSTEESEKPANLEVAEVKEIAMNVSSPELPETTPIIAEVKEQAAALQQVEVAQVLALAETAEVLEEGSQFHAEHLFNLSNLAVMSDGDIAFQKEFLGVCIQSFEEFRIDYRSALLSQNTPQIRGLLHKMRPALQLMNILALDPVIEQGSQLLQEAKVDTDSLNQIVRQMDSISGQIIRELEITAQGLH